MLLFWVALVVLSGSLLVGLNIFVFGGLETAILSSNFFSIESGFSNNDYLCFSMLAFCGLIAILFSLHYFGWTQNNLNKLIIAFLGVMGCLVLSEDYINSLFWWEYLGVVSFFLILYYGNFDTLFAGNTTIVASRGGDVGFFLLICYFITGNSFCLLGSISILLIILTKSAVIPFCSWLLEAMRAPTPVSCLVHSSTLVAAGVWFVSSYGYLILSNSLVNILLVACLLTILVSGTVAIVFSDIKKIVALSTCNNVSWCIVYYLLGNPLLCVSQLVCHGVGKCMLFIAVGDALSSAGGSQNKSCFTLTANNTMSGFFGVLCLSVSVAGFPFLGVFFTKHGLLNCLFCNGSLVMSLFICCCAFVSYVYSSRLIFLMVSPFSCNNQWLNNTYYLLSTIVILCSVFGYLLSNNLEELSELNNIQSILISLLNLFGVFVGYYYYMSICNKSYYSSFGFNDDSVLNILQGFSVLGVLNSILFNYRPEVGLVSYLLGVKSSSIIRITVVPMLLTSLLLITLI
nr:NADH dehydrogenase subunit 5 [Cichlidogyrus tilapiae]